MSVHSEYGRALETLIASLRALNGADRETWLSRFVEARVDRQPDLTAAARHSVAAVRDLAATDPAPRLVEASNNLLAHCRMILGTTV